MKSRVVYIDGNVEWKIGGDIIFRVERNSEASGLIGAIDTSEPGFWECVKEISKSPGGPPYHAQDGRIIGALRQTIKDHGPITRKYISSAAKRLATNLNGNLASERVTKSIPPTPPDHITGVGKKVQGEKT